MQTIFKIFLALHIAGGTTALITGLIAMLTKKGGRAHRLNGKLYFGGMTFVFITSIYMSIAHDIPFLLMVGFFSYFLVCRGYRILFLKKLGQGGKAMPIDWTIAVVGLLAGIGLIAYGAAVAGRNFIGYVAIVFGGLSILFSIRDMRLFRNGASEKMHWWYGHIAAMGGGYIATVTAFMVVNIKFLPGIVVWLTPTVVGGILIGATIRKYKIRFAPKVTA
jgi:uncharacterized membrane protein